LKTYLLFQRGENDLRNDFVASGLVMNTNKSKLLVVFHNKLRKWLPPGGHLLPNELPHECAIREVFEETGITATIIDSSPDLELIGNQETKIPAPYFLLHELIPANNKDVEHMHVDFIYLMESEESDVTIQLEEVSAVKWMKKEEILNADTFDSIKKICTKILVSD
jgi:8-oxo-dGTP diphosphatase